MIDDRRGGEPRVGAAQRRRHLRMAHGHAAHMHFVDDRVMPGRARRAVIAPGERGIDDAALGRAGGAVTFVERQVQLRVGGVVAEVRIAPAHPPRQQPRIRFDQQFVGIEAVAALRIVRAVAAIAVQQAGTRLGQVAVPDLVGVFVQRDALHFVPTGGIEEAQLHLGRVFREQRKVDAFAIPGGAARIGIARPDRRHCGDRNSTPSGGRVSVRECGRPCVLWSSAITAP